MERYVSPKVQQIVFYSNKWPNTKLKLWDVQTGKCYRTVEGHGQSGHTDSVLSLAISNLGWTLHSGSGDMTIKVWNLGTQQCQQTLQGHSDSVTCLALYNTSKGKKMLVSGSRDRTVQ
ncbi:WD-40 repeat-containing protein [Nitzschia inconspicua]|uniref:WD-40 repeat-containing protein n=1 Tax=Nitzschia inconspicua TaxID=303405 RepID=A0A9K3K627_9STRA|nr:WD-40 repeat-containing protein [Nitzschia inconspicua]